MEEKVRLVTRNLEEVITPQELRELLEVENRPRAYWGFEPSGLMHLGTGLVCGYKIKDFVEAGFDFIIFLADWHAWINNKLGGNLDDIKFCADYFIHGFSSLGLTSSCVSYIRASQLVAKPEYWEKVIKIAKKSNLSRTIRCLPIMGREQNPTDLETASLFYPSMQVADIFQLKVDCACAGLDQRKAHMLARENAEKLGFKKPLCIHTHLLLGLSGGQDEVEGSFDEDADVNLQISTKMSKSQPKRCIYIHDSPAEIQQKLAEAYCPPRQIEGNPVLEIARYVVFAKENTLKISRPAKYGGPMEFTSYPELEKTYSEGKLHPFDLKVGVAEALTAQLKPVRSYFKDKQEILKRMVQLEITR